MQVLTYKIRRLNFLEMKILDFYCWLILAVHNRIFKKALARILHN